MISNRFLLPGTTLKNGGTELVLVTGYPDTLKLILVNTEANCVTSWVVLTSSVHNAVGRGWCGVWEKDLPNPLIVVKAVEIIPTNPASIELSIPSSLLKKSEERVFYAHLRLKDEYGNILPKGGMTIAWRQPRQGEFIANYEVAIVVAIAVCGAKDNFVKARGRELAFKRLNKEKNCMYLTFSDKPKLDQILIALREVNAFCKIHKYVKGDSWYKRSRLLKKAYDLELL